VLLQKGQFGSHGVIVRFEEWRVVPAGKQDELGIAGSFGHLYGRPSQRRLVRFARDHEQWTLDPSSQTARSVKAEAQSGPRRNQLRPVVRAVQRDEGTVAIERVGSGVRPEE